MFAVNCAWRGTAEPGAENCAKTARILKTKMGGNDITK
ncbi:hypothetical protein A2U01_0014158, partial [Trifolium medium]|nr:hypothetical protein [Trifolium medium]